MKVVAVMSTFIHTHMMLALWVLPAHHLKREKNKQKVRSHRPAQSDDSKYTFTETKK